MDSEEKEKLLRSILKHDLKENALIKVDDEIHYHFKTKTYFESLTRPNMILLFVCVVQFIFMLFSIVKFNHWSTDVKSLYLSFYAIILAIIAPFIQKFFESKSQKEINKKVELYLHLIGLILLGFSDEGTTTKRKKEFENELLKIMKYNNLDEFYSDKDFFTANIIIKLKELQDKYKK
ncbi:hypothetical protein [Sporolactobacillus terrae]|uniref:hypothetical protein n=1 Tax=Sporolactobacillus terrae TaxID=269673 RepID=UPI0004912E56|nr:hypothetical protein [Sporolactobacillus terrae]